ncbi:MAG: helix-hairpin-helix domain-containing protein [Desulfobacterales bacterium]|uniref:Helix-hairpin-helix domain-containing protein n=1 Tax=Candidatus Desulfaltia bathyphila TaxID=2841697 RepID=A0A8J6N5C9_9BACT|nr:helix-hairpin-helix domain-containing protein [Candidatus Desulfaltia bathyphila]MBL7207503.1 helix-hairpin-helix domain-containing protein [Desulfobacterales bacterium]
MKRNYCLLLFSVLVLFILSESSAICQGWTDLRIRLLPDSSFAVVEVKTGKKIRHCPHHDSNGKIDEEQLIYVLGTLDRETWLDPKNEKVARKHLENHYDKFIAKVMKKGLHGSVNINRAKLTQLVALPRIGPVLAVKIVKYRNMHGLFEKIKDIKKVQGIGSGTFNAIKHYIIAN